jgi:hypothetical protein
MTYKEEFGEDSQQSHQEVNYSIIVIIYLKYFSDFRRALAASASSVLF